MIHTVKGFSIVSEPDVDIFLGKIEEKNILEFEDISVETKKQREKNTGDKTKNKIEYLWIVDNYKRCNIHARGKSEGEEKNSLKK